MLSHLLCLALGAAAAAAAPAPPSTRAALSSSGDFDVYSAGLKNGWQDWGWAHRELVPNGPARLHLSRYAGWILAHHALPADYTQLTVRLHAPADFGTFLEVRLGHGSEGTDTFPKLPLKHDEGVAQADGSKQWTLPMAQLNPTGEPFDRIVLHATRAVSDEAVEVRYVGLTPAAPGQLLTRAPAAPKPHRPVHLAIDCRGPKRAISPYIYGIAFSPRHAAKDEGIWALGSTIRRWGGNPASRYNWQLGNAWNTASDWFYTNVNYTGIERYSWRNFLEENAAHETKSAITVPMLGWVAKDTESHAFSVSALGPQQYSARDAGNGVDKAGHKLKSPDPHVTSIEAPPAFAAEWVRALEAWQKDGHAGAIPQYILDNEPALWNSTHRDVHPEALTYDELLSRTLSYGSAVRKSAPHALIAGPAEWGWPAYFYSARDAEVGFRAKPDRRSHGDVPLIDWYLRRLHEHANKTGEHVLDVLDLHYYPQTSGVYGRGEQTGPDAAARRLRATRSLWDPSFKDESWIAENIELLPRMQRLIDANYPGRRISIGEYNFGGERHISGALALAEALGRFGQAGVYSAYLWTYPPQNSISAEAFRAYRNYDNAGHSFPEQGLATKMGPQVSLFAARDPKDDRLVAMALNLNADFDADADIELIGCGDYTKARTFTLSAGEPQLHAAVQGSSAAPSQAAVRRTLDAYSLTVLELSR